MTDSIGPGNRPGDTPVGGDRHMDRIATLGACLAGCDVALVIRSGDDGCLGWGRSWPGGDLRAVDYPRLAAVVQAAPTDDDGVVMADAAAAPEGDVTAVALRGMGLAFAARVPLSMGGRISLILAGCQAGPQGLPGHVVCGLRVLGDLVRDGVNTAVTPLAMSASGLSADLIPVMKRVVGVGFAFLDEDGVFLDLNGYVARLLGGEPASLTGSSFLDLTPVHYREDVAESFRRVIHDGLRVRGEWPILTTEGVLRRTSVSSERFEYGGRPVCLSVIADVTHQYADHALRQAQARLLKQVVLEKPLPELLRGVGEVVRTHRPRAGVLVMHRHNDGLDVESAVAGSDGTQAFIDALATDDTRAPWATSVTNNRQVMAADLGADEWRGECARLARHCGVRGVWCWPLRAQDGGALGCLVVLLERTGLPVEWEAEFLDELSDLTGFALERQDRIEGLRRSALYDDLTGAANRTLLDDRLAALRAGDARAGSRTAVLLLDLDDFKAINDTYGHACGDELLVAAVARIRKALRADDTVARVGGDEFVVVLADADEATARGVAGRVLEQFDEPVQLGTHSVAIRPSVGAAVGPAGGGDPEALLKAADQAMYNAKRAGKGTYYLSA
ncbi:hypothetical protein KBTX_03939 [wastewater metagenome]|uniref:Uncharacterized protein n=3 Tax=root TaxID=1 RepID=A0A5B8RG27_9ZZZZ|nr:hypothetical protein KBTEX_03939 [uncultured organism]